MRLKTKFSLLISVLVSIIVIGVTVFLYIAESRFLVAEMERTRAKMIESFAQVAKESLIVKDEILLLNYVKLIAHTKGLAYALVSDMNNTVLAHTDIRLLGSVLADPITAKAVAASGLVVQKYTDAAQAPLLDLAYPVRINDGAAGVVRIGFSQEVLNNEVQESLAVTRKRIGMVAVAALITGIIGAFILTGMMAGPIKKIARGAQIIGQGKLDHTIDVKSKDELGDLAREFNRMSNKLKELDQLKSDFVSSVTHELRSPIISLRMYLSTFLEDTAGDRAKEKEYIGIMESCAARLNHFIDDLLDIAKIERGKMEVKPQEMDLVPIIDETVQLFQPQFTKKGIHFEKHTAEQLPFVFADPERLRQVLTNLISNAFKFTPEGGEITVTTALNKSSQLVEVSVRDTGIGIPEDQVGIIFNKFEQVKSAKQSVSGPKGTGLGLAIIKGILEAQGGDVWVRSELNKGSTFTFSVALAKK